MAVQVAVGDLWPGALDPCCVRLSRHYITSRYPDAVPGGVPEDHFDASDAEQALADSRAVIGAVDAAWGELTR